MELGGESFGELAIFCAFFFPAQAGGQVAGESGGLDLEYLWGGFEECWFLCPQVVLGGEVLLGGKLQVMGQGFGKLFEEAVVGSGEP